jgi:hypothetical protein
MDRRTFVTCAMALFTAPLAAGAQHAGKVPRIGVLFFSSAGPHAYLDAFRQGLPL